MINSRYFIFSLTILIIIFSVSFDCLGESVEVYVDVSKPLGPLPEIFAPNVWMANTHRSENRYIIGKFLDENSPSVLHLTLRSLRESKSFDDFKKRFNSFLHLETVVTIMKKVKKYNTTLIVGFETATMPGWLSSRQNVLSKIDRNEDWTVEQTSPPRDYRLWGEVVSFTLKSIKKKFSLKKLGFFVGHEVDAYWFGSRDSFFRFYKFTAKAVKEVNKKIKVGGIGTQGVITTKRKCTYFTRDVRAFCSNDHRWTDPEGEPMLKNFIEYISKNNVPLDFLNWHSFGIMPNRLIEQTNTIRKWLINAGIDESRIILYPSDWTYWQFPIGYPADILDTEEAAAYAIQTLYYMWKAGIRWHGHDFDIDRPRSEMKIKKHRQGTTFVGNWAIFTPDKVVKPIYNAFKALSIIKKKEKSTPRMLDVRFIPEDRLAGISVVKDDKIILLLSNFFPNEPIFLHRIILQAIRKEMLLDDDFKEIAKCVRQKINKIANKKMGLNLCIQKVRQRKKDNNRLEAIDFAINFYNCKQTEKPISVCLQEAAINLKNAENIQNANNIREMVRRNQKSVSAKVEFMGLPFKGDIELNKYFIDSRNSNSCKLNKRTESHITDTPCGIGGAIDKSVVEINKIANEVAKKIALDYLFSLGYPKTLVSRLLTYLKSCSYGIKECANNYIEDRKISSEFPKFKTHFMRAYDKYRHAFYDTYHFGNYKSVSTLNSSEGISIESSKQTEILQATNGKYIVNLHMEPNSIILLILNNKS